MMAARKAAGEEESMGRNWSEKVELGEDQVTLGLSTEREDPGRITAETAPEMEEMRSRTRKKNWGFI